MDIVETETKWRNNLMVLNLLTKQVSHFCIGQLVTLSEPLYPCTTCFEIEPRVCQHSQSILQATVLQYIPYLNNHQFDAINYVKTPMLTLRLGHMSEKMVVLSLR